MEARQDVRSVPTRSILFAVVLLLALMMAVGAWYALASRPISRGALGTLAPMTTNAGISDRTLSADPYSPRDPLVRDKSPDPYSPRDPLGASH